ncbi:MAG: methyltransferase domain-containing protein [bacterium]|nr:methyltransferase domain-containing protein [bacterium]
MEALHEIISERVRDQYEQFPYPDIDPDYMQPQMLVSGHLSLMCKILWAGKVLPGNLRVLDAGCGTGGPLAAAAMAYPETQFTGIDFSETSLDKARRLIQRLGIKNVRLHHLPIQRLPELGQTFDFVISSGVLHHLPDPAAGLNSICKVLDKQGAVSIMLYGKYGRIGINMLQHALSTIFPQNTPYKEKIPAALNLTKQLPQNHPMAKKKKGRELQEGKDSGIVDLLLHANDIPFDVPAVYRMCNQAGMKFHNWLFPLIYRPENFLKSPHLRESMQGMSEEDKHVLAELVHGRNAKHSFFAVRPEFKAPDTRITDGNWRKLHGELTPCLAWKRTYPVPGKKGYYLIPPAVVQDAWEPLEISQWQLTFLGHIQPDMPMGKSIEMPAVRQVLPFHSPAAIDAAMRELLEKVLDMTAVVLLEP